MSARASYRFEQRIRAPRGLVWELLSDHAGYSAWSFARTSYLVQEGEDDSNGVGAVRFLGSGRIGSREEVLAFAPQEHLAYTILSGFPARGYRADVRLADAEDGGTLMVWEGSFTVKPALARPAVTAMARLAVGALVRALTRAAERRAA